MYSSPELKSTPCQSHGAKEAGSSTAGTLHTTFYCEMKSLTYVRTKLRGFRGAAECKCQ